MNSYICARYKVKMICTIDVGNTRIKAAVFEGSTLVEYFVIPNNRIKKSIENIVEKYLQVTNIVVSSVRNHNESDFISDNPSIKTHFVSKQDIFPFKNLYDSPATLGIDRMILASGAVISYPNKNRLVIGVGTCITYDFINEKDEYLGGAISPGLRLRYESLHHYTDKLPLLSLPTAVGTEDTIGKSTNQSIHSGVINGLIHEVQGFIESYTSQYQNFIIILTGGDANFLAKRLKNTIFANPNFLLESLCYTFQYKIKK
jgi:type III pantothenate kinase